MSAYRRVILSTTVFSVGLAIVATLLQQAQAQVLFSGVLLIEAIGDVVATAYLAYLAYKDKSRPRGWLMLFLVVGATLISLGYVTIAALLVIRAAGIVIPASLGLTITGEAVVLVGAVPIMKAALFWLVQHDSSIEGGIVAEESMVRRALLQMDVARALDDNDVKVAARLIMLSLQAQQN